MTRNDFWVLFDKTTSDEERFELHEQYYSQFVTDKLLTYLGEKVNLDELKDTKYWNDKSLGYWNPIAGVYGGPGGVYTVRIPYVDVAYFRKLNGTGPSASEAISIIKTGVRILWKRRQAKEKE